MSDTRLLPPYASGLIVGKFAPLHRGHEFVIRRAMEVCGTVYIVSWSKPEMAGCEPDRRAAWLERLFPSTRRLVLTDAVLATLDPPPEFASLPENDRDPVGHRRFCAWVCERVWQAQPEAVFTSEAYGGPLASEMTEWFRRSHRSHRGVTAVSVDPERRAIPVSGSMLRQDIHRHREWLSPEVYCDFVKRAVMLGAESTGKSTLAAALAARLGTVHVPEYGRELWEARGGGLEFPDMLAIAREQIAREESAAGTANAWVICDTSPLTTLFYSQQIFHAAEPALVELAARFYHLTVLCAPDIALVDDGTRHDDAFRRAQDGWYRCELANRRVKYVVARGSVAERVARLARVDWSVAP